jgi:hypothetical protein
VLGRPALNYERFEAPSIDPDAPEIQAHWQIRRAEEALTRSWFAHNQDNDYIRDWPDDNGYE